MNEIEYPADNEVDGENADGGDIMDWYAQISQHAGDEPGCSEACQDCREKDEYENAKELQECQCCRD